MPVANKGYKTCRQDYFDYFNSGLQARFIARRWQQSYTLKFTVTILILMGIFSGLKDLFFGKKENSNEDRTENIVTDQSTLPIFTKEALK